MDSVVGRQAAPRLRRLFHSIRERTDSQIRLLRNDRKGLVHALDRWGFYPRTKPLPGHSAPLIDLRLWGDARWEQG